MPGACPYDHHRGRALRHPRHGAPDQRHDEPGSPEVPAQGQGFRRGAILDESSDSHFLCVGDVNQRFIREFLATEGIPLLSEDLGGELGRVIHFHTDTFQVFRKFIPKTQTLRIEKRELGLWKRQVEKPEDREGSIILF
ncbi:MAG: hypothetical protein MZV64_09515 [Ignavibacteriales bacterium]|nr:hypothetical protein [Ignavibacteriales bacterium]